MCFFHGKLKARPGGGKKATVLQKHRAAFNGFHEWLLCNQPQSVSCNITIRIEIDLARYGGTPVVPWWLCRKLHIEFELYT